MDYKKTFTKTITDARTPLRGCVEVFNYIAFSRYFEHRALHETIDSGVYTNDEEDWTVTKISDLIEELYYWLSCYYESGHCRHEEEFADRLLLIRGIETLKVYSNPFESHWLSYIPKNKDTQGLFKEVV